MKTLYTIRSVTKLYQTTNTALAWTFCLSTGAQVIKKESVNYEVNELETKGVLV